MERNPVGQSVPRVVIVGSGFGGLNAAKALAKAPVNVTLIDRKNHHTFQPLLYQVATAGLSPGEIATPIRSIFRRNKNVEVILGEVTEVNLDRRELSVGEHEIPYDYLIIAAGASHAYFGHDEWQHLAPGLKSIEDAIEIRRRILLAFELAERRAAEGEKSPPLNFVVVGAGPTGVELAGTLAEICRHALAGDFRKIAPENARIHLIEGGPHVLPTYSEDLSRSALEQLRRLGVDVITGAAVTRIEPGAVYMGDTRLEAAVILWAAGVAASPLGRKLGLPVDRAGRVQVQPDLRVPGHPEVFVIGDMAALKDDSGHLLPGVAQVAIQEGRFAAHKIRSDVEGKDDSASAFRYHDKGSLATIGRAAAVAQIGKIHISGFLAWVTWLFVHIFFLIGFENRILVFVQWAWSYFTYERGARLITGGTSLPGWEEESPEQKPRDEEFSAAATK